MGSVGARCDISYGCGVAVKPKVRHFVVLLGVGVVALAAFCIARHLEPRPPMEGGIYHGSWPLRDCISSYRGFSSDGRIYGLPAKVDLRTFLNGDEFETRFLSGDQQCRAHILHVAQYYSGLMGAFRWPSGYPELRYTPELFSCAVVYAGGDEEDSPSVVVAGCAPHETLMVTEYGVEWRRRSKADQILYVPEHKDQNQTWQEGYWSSELATEFVLCGDSADSIDGC